VTAPVEATSYRLCRAGGDLRSEIDAAYPNRDRTSDGWVGDTSHQARKSDHNPDYDYRPGVVKALDIDQNGVPLDEIFERIRLLGANGDIRLQGGYLIRNSRIAGTHTSWAWHRYTGSNPHTGHGHISFADRQEGFDRLGDWPVVPARPEPSPVIPGVHEHRTATIHRRDVGHPAEIRDLQQHLNAWRHNRQLSEHPVDGRWDEWLETAWRTFQKTYGLEVDGICGPDGWSMLHKVTKGVRRG
jgi:hypothetical protein